MPGKFVPSRLVAALCAVFVLFTVPAALADDGRRGHDRGDARWYHANHDKHRDKHWEKHRDKRWEKHREGHWKKHAAKHHARKHHRGHGRHVVVWHGKRHWSPPPRRVVHHHVHRHKPAHGHGSYYRRDRDDWAVYAILALQLVEVLNNSQQQSYAQAQYQAVSAPLGDSIQWHDSGAYGSVTAVRDGSDGGGRYCREFQHQIVVGNRQESGYGIACRQPDGAWEIVS